MRVRIRFRVHRASTRNMRWSGSGVLWATTACREPSTAIVVNTSPRTAGWQATTRRRCGGAAALPGSPVPGGAAADAVRLRRRHRVCLHADALNQHSRTRHGRPPDYAQATDEAVPKAHYHRGVIWHGCLSCVLETLVCSCACLCTPSAASRQCMLAPGQRAPLCWPQCQLLISAGPIASQHVLGRRSYPPRVHMHQCTNAPHVRVPSQQTHISPSYSARP